MKYLIALLAVAGIVASSLALHVHYMDPAQAPPCAITEKFDCGTVNHGKYSVFPPLSFDDKPGAVHVPIAAIGIAGYLLIGALALAGRRFLTFEFAQIGFFCASFLSYIEAFIIQKWCIYCLWSQCILTVILVLSAIQLFLHRRQRIT